MHGRLKVRSTAEQEEAKRFEREKKLKFYKKVTSDCLERIKLKDYNESGLKLTDDILMANPDVLTLWNLRRNILLDFENYKTLDELDNTYKNELTMSELALRQNPKSYGSWLHRQWCLKQTSKLNLKSASINWQNELQLCNKYLSLDERNFHCWAHRQFIVSHSNQVSKSDEFKYTFDKIGTNFSNYSSWHYRSKLIKDLYLYPEEDGTKITRDFFQTEITIIENAVFTDPNDQSAWVYHRWLFNEYLHHNILKRISISSSFKKIQLSFFTNVIDKLISMKLNMINIQLNENNLKSTTIDNALMLEWDGESPIESTTISKNIKLELCFTGIGDLHFILEKNDTDSSYSYESIFVWDVDDNLFKNHINNLKDLSELEADKNKWVLVTLIYLMSFTDYKFHQQTIESYFNRLIDEIDCTRKQYYCDWKGKILKNNF